MVVNHSRCYTINDRNSISVGKYRLEPLLQIRRDDIRGFLPKKLGIYICEFQSPEWCSKFGIQECFAVGHGQKKGKIFEQMQQGSIWLSPTSKLPAKFTTETWINGAILHLGNKGFNKRIEQLLQTLFIFKYIVHSRRKFSYCLVYNFDMPFYIAPLLFKLIFRKLLYVDYEDDYTKRNSSILKCLCERLLRKTIDGCICVNENMCVSFPPNKAIVSNAFANLDYVKQADFNFREGMKFIFSGTLDRIRGVDLIPSIVKALEKRISDFKIIITGRGPLFSEVKSWRHPKIDYVGFLDYSEYIKVLETVDACLILQKPDHPFSKGSFPSKIEEYSRFKKPIYVVK